MRTSRARRLLPLCLLAFSAVAALAAGANPYDADPFLDNPSSTYALLFPQTEVFIPPPPAPNAQNCKDVWDKGIPCADDGLFYGYWGELQPEYCDHDHFEKDGKTVKPEAEKCTCNVAMMTDPDKCPADAAPVVVDGATCKVYCREKDHCHCVNICDMNGNLGNSPQPKKAPAARRKK